MIEVRWELNKSLRQSRLNISLLFHTCLLLLTFITGKSTYLGRLGMPVDPIMFGIMDSRPSVLAPQYFSGKSLIKVRDCFELVTHLLATYVFWFCLVSCFITHTSPWVPVLLAGYVKFKGVRGGGNKRSNSDPVTAAGNWGKWVRIRSHPEQL